MTLFSFEHSKLEKNVTAISTVLVLSSAGTLPLIFVLNLNDSEFAISASFCSSLKHCLKLLDFLNNYHNIHWQLYIGITALRYFA